MSVLLVGVLTAALVLAWRYRKRLAKPRRGAALAVVVGVLGVQALIGAPAFAQGFLDCKQAPEPDRPGSGMVGALDPAPRDTGVPGSVYDEVGYAGLVWHTYDVGCGGANDPNAVVDTWVGNELFNVAKNVVGATNGLHYALLRGDLLKPLDDLLNKGTGAMYRSVFTPLFGVVALLLAVLLFRYIWQGDLAAIGKRSTWALAALWFASATYLTPLVYTQALDNVVIQSTSAVQAGFLNELGIDQRNALPTDLHDQVIYQNWLRGEFGSPVSPQARQYGRDLLRAQTWTKQEVARGEDNGSSQVKQQQFQQIASELEPTSAYGYFQGVQGSRVGDGMLALLESLAFASFQFLAKATILLAQVLLRVVILAGPLIGLVALVYHDLLRAVGRLAGAAMLNVVLISAMAGMHTMILTWIFDPAHGLSPLTQIMLAGLVTAVFLLIGKPVRRMGQMVELSVGRVGGSASRHSPTLLPFLRRGRRNDIPTSDQFWDHVQSSDFDEADDQQEAPTGRRRRRVRPEADPPVAATAERMDRYGTAQPLPSSGALPLDSGGGATSLPAAGSGAPRRPGSTSDTRALPPERPSRVVDTSPVSNARWDLRDDDVVLVPSRSDDADAGPVERPAPRPAEKEVVAGRPVYVVYRPSRGLEVAGDD